MALIQVRVVSDVACPWCFVGQRTLKKALENFRDTEFQISWEPYIVNPSVPEQGYGLEEYYKKNWGMGLAAVKRSPMAKALDEFNLEFDWSRRIVPSLKPNALVEASGPYGVQNAVVERLMEEFFLNGADISAPKTLKQIATELNVGNVLVGDGGHLLAGDGGEFELSPGLLENTTKVADYHRKHLGAGHSGGVPHFKIKLAKYEVEMTSPKTEELADSIQRIVNEFYFHKYGGA